MKKIIAIILTAVMLLSFASCADETPTGTGTSGTNPTGTAGFTVPPYTTPDEILNDTDRVAVTGISLDVTSKSINVNDLFIIRTTVAPADATYKDVFWFSSDTDVVNTLGGGMISGVADGKATVYARTVDGGFYASCEVTVGTGVKTDKVDPDAMTGIKLSESFLNMYVDDNQKLEVTPLPEGIEYNDSYVWSTSDDSVASVDVNGRVYANAVGEAKITASTKDKKFSATCTVIVADIADEKGVTGITIDVTEKKIAVGESFDIIATVLPEHAANKFVFWEVSDDKIASVTNKGESAGTITGLKAGTVTITAKTMEGGFTVTCTVTVE